MPCPLHAFPLSDRETQTVAVAATEFRLQVIALSEALCDHSAPTTRMPWQDGELTGCMAGEGHDAAL